MSSAKLNPERKLKINSDTSMFELSRAVQRGKSGEIWIVYISHFSAPQLSPDLTDTVQLHHTNFCINSSSWEKI